MANVDATTEATPQLAAQIAALEQRLYRAQVAGSVADIEPMLSADLRYLHSTGVAETRGEYLKGVRDRSTSMARSRAARCASTSRRTWRSRTASST